MKTILTISFLVIHTLLCKCEKVVFCINTISPNEEQKSILLQSVNSFILGNINASYIDSLLRTKNEWDEIEFSCDSLLFLFSLKSNNLRSPNYKIRIQDNEVISEQPTNRLTTYAGVLHNTAGEIRLTTNINFFSGGILLVNDEIYIEDASKYLGIDVKDLYIIYRKSSINNTLFNNFQCIQNQTNLPELYKDAERLNQWTQRVTLPVCKVVEIALANDWLMYNKYGSISALENHIFAVLNLVETNYDNEFDFNFELTVAEVFIVTQQGTDPWTSSTNPQTLLPSFTNWAPNGFYNEHDVATLWTDRDLDGNTVGYAWISSVCSNNRYNIVQDFTSYLPYLRVLQAHEIGHNFAALHDAENSGYIMAPSVNETDMWSSASLTAINTKISSSYCLESCCDNPPMPPFNGDYTIGPTGDYLFLSTAMEDLWYYGMSGNTTLLIEDSIVEPSIVQIIPWSSCNNEEYSLTIKPDSGVTSLISGNFDVNSTLININGADHLIVDGSNNGSSSHDLTFRNIGFGSTIRFVNGATFNTFKNCVIEGKSGGSVGNIRFFTSSAGQPGNSNNYFYNCKVRDRTDASSQPSFGIYSNGSGSAPNSNNVFRKCDIFNWTSEGIRVSVNGVGNGWVIDSCNFYRTTSTSNQLTGIRFDGGSGHTISHNFIGGSESAAEGSYLSTTNAFGGIFMNLDTNGTAIIKDNLIQNVRSTYTGINLSYGIFVAAGIVDIGNLIGNHIGGISSDKRLELNNCAGIRISNIANVTVQNNIVYNLRTSVSPPVGMYLYGIFVQGDNPTAIIENNLIHNLKNTSVPGSSKNTETIGIFINGKSSSTIDGNQIDTISSESNNTSSTLRNRIWAIRTINIDSNSIISNNIINELTSTTTSGTSLSDQLIGIGSEGTSFSTIFNNMISLDGGVNQRVEIVGLENNCVQASSNKYLYNSVNIYGTGSGIESTYGFIRRDLGTVNIKNNILCNSRTGGTGNHSAIANKSTSATGWPPGSSDYGILYNTNKNHLANWLGIPKTFTQWKAAQNDPLPGSGSDSNSVMGKPGFESDIDLHIDTSSCFADGRALNVMEIDLDIDGDSRDNVSPDIGADEYTPVPDITPVVRNDENDGAGSLRDIVDCALPGTTITIDNLLLGDTIKLTSEIDINKNLILLGLGTSNSFISGSLINRVFHIYGGNTMTLKNMTLINGYSPVQGGSMLIEGIGSIENILLKNNYEGINPKALTLSGNASLFINGTVEIKQ